MGKKKGGKPKIEHGVSFSHESGEQGPSVLRFSDKEASSAHMQQKSSIKNLAKTASSRKSISRDSRSRSGVKSGSSVLMKQKSKDSVGSSYGSSGSSGSFYSEEEEVEEEPVILSLKRSISKPKKLPKKGKKQKKEAEVIEVEVPPPPPPDDISATLSFMKRTLAEKIAELEAEPVVEEEEPPKKKKKEKKKKLSKKEKALLKAELAEKAKLNPEEEAAKLAELERIRLEEERKAAIHKERMETFEQQIRMEALESTRKFLKILILHSKELREAAKKEQEWEFYLNCARLPDPSKCDQINTFLHLWENMMEETTMEEAARRTNDVLELLDDLDNLIETAENPDCELVENWKWVRLLFREHQAKSLDVATYRLLRDIENNLHRIDIPTADYKYHDDNIALCLWLRIQLPTPLPNPRRPPKPRIDVNFAEMKMRVLFPIIIDGEKLVIRALYVKYDHLSDLSETYQKPATTELYELDLFDTMKKEWREKMWYKYENRIIKPVVQEDGEEEPEPEKVIGPEDEVPAVPYRKLEPTASELVITNEDNLYSSTRTGLLKEVDQHVVNLRKYSIIGGVYILNLIKQPPQPQDFVTMEMTLTPLYLPKELEFEDFYVEYTPILTEAVTEMTPEEIEEAMKKQEEELDKLIQITITWPEHVIFLEQPTVAHWDEKNKAWSKSEVHDLKHNEENKQLSFRTGTFGSFALVTHRYVNLPYQAWEMRPEADGSVTLQITTAILMVEFNVKNGQVTLSQLLNSPNKALQDIVGVYYPLPRLMRKLQVAGVDVFPAFDAFCYVENACEKHWPMEKHLYLNMAQLSGCFNFVSSKWNIPAGRRGAVMQMREYDLEKTKQKNYSTLMVSPLSALYVDCTEVSPEFSAEPMENMKFYPDLYSLIKGTSTMALKNKIKDGSRESAFSVFELLVATRVVSFS